MSVVSGNVNNPNPRPKMGSVRKGFMAFGIGMNIIMPVMTYNAARGEGDSVAMAATKAGAEAVAWQVAAPAMFGLMLGEGAKALTEAGIVAGRSNRAWVGRHFVSNFGGHYVDSEGAANMRQAGMYNIQQSKAATQSGLGSEAKAYARRS